MTLQEHIDEVMDYFDFATVHRVMELLSWEWESAGGVPEIPHLRSMVRKLIKEAWEMLQRAPDRSCCTSTGGFVVSVQRMKDGENVDVAFVPVHWETHPDPDSVISLN